MPIYEYQCRRCGKDFEALIWKAEEELDLACPQCRCSEVERVLSTFCTAGTDNNSDRANCNSSGGFG